MQVIKYSEAVDVELIDDDRLDDKLKCKLCSEFCKHGVIMFDPDEEFDGATLKFIYDVYSASGYMSNDPDAPDDHRELINVLVVTPNYIIAPTNDLVCELFEKYQKQAIKLERGDGQICGRY